MPPADQRPGHWWAQQRDTLAADDGEDPGPTRMDHLMHQLREYLDPKHGPRPPQVALELVDQGERPPWEDASNPSDWTRPRLEAVVWIGPTREAEQALGRIIADDVVGTFLCAGANIQVSPRGVGGWEEQRQEAENIRQRLDGPPSGSAAPIADQAMHLATVAAYGTGTSPPEPPQTERAEDLKPTDGTEEPAQQPLKTIRDWAFWADKVTFRTHTVDVKGNERRLLEALVAGPLRKDALMKKVWGAYDTEPSTFHSTLSHLRGALRASFGMSKTEEPIPSTGSKDLLAYQIDEELLGRYCGG